MEGVSLIISFIIAIILMIVAISKYKVHPFIAIMAISLILAFVAGIPLDKIPSTIGSGFSATFTSIGIVIILGALIGTILEKSGGALKLSDMVIRLIGKKYPEVAMLIMGWIVSIPVFCDSGFVILNSIRKSLVQRVQSSSVSATVALSAGLYISHVFIPPTPGPIAAANSLGIGNNLLLIMGLGIIVSIPALIAGLIFAKYIGKRVKSSEDDNKEIVKTYEELVESYGTLPSGFMTLAPIVIPILLMALASFVSVMNFQSELTNLLKFLGTPIIALSVGFIFSVILLFSQKMSKDFYDITNDTLKIVGPILFITAAGGVLGKVIAVSGFVGFIKSNSDILSSVGIFFPFILAAILKSAQGSSTVAITTTAGILAPIMVGLGLDSTILTALTVIAIGAGAMSVSHANDSYFWVVTNFGGIKAQDGYKTQTLMTLIVGLTSIFTVFIITLFI